MAHDISTESGKPEFLYNKANGRPWHGLGEALESFVSPVEAARKAFPWSVEAVPVATLDGTLIPGRKAVIRSDTRRVLGIVGRKHTLVQNADFAQAVENVFGQAKAVIDTAGALGVGERTFMLAKLPEGFEVRRDDRVERFLLACNNHDGLGSVKLLFTSIRVVCNNTLTAALRSASHVVALRHTKNISLGIEHATKILARSETYWQEMRAFLASLAERQMTVADFAAFLAALVADTTMDENGRPAPSPQAQATRATLTALFEGQGLVGADLDGGKNRWRALNVVTQFIDTLRPVRGKTNRIESSLFGDGLAGQMRAKAVELLAAPSFPAPPSAPSFS